MRALTRLAPVLSCMALSFAAGAASPQRSYTWSDIDCSQSRIAAWPGLKCRSTNVVTSESNVGSFRQWAAFGTTREGCVQLFVWEPQNAFSFVTTEDTTADFLKWMYVNGRQVSQFGPVVRHHDADYAMFRDGSRNCAGFRRTGAPRRGGYDKIVAGILCAPAGGNLTPDQFVQFIDRVRLQ